MRATHLIGVDEAGRGPLAGPVAVGVVQVPRAFDWECIPGVTDSKKLSATQRDAIFERALVLRQRGQLDFAVAQVGPTVIDEQGITTAIAIAMRRCIARLRLRPEEVSFRLDGSLFAPPQFAQATIKKGDALWPEIGLASIAAKVTRDRYMDRIARRYTRYGFAEHKGYGTKAHRAAIAQYGKCPIHRVSYCKNIEIQ